MEGNTKLRVPANMVAAYSTKGELMSQPRLIESVQPAPLRCAMKRSLPPHPPQYAVPRAIYSQNRFRPSSLYYWHHSLSIVKQDSTELEPQLSGIEASEDTPLPSKAAPSNIVNFRIGSCTTPPSGSRNNFATKTLPAVR